MAVMKKKGERTVPAMSTTSLPDVVYIILFFFMLSTSMRDQELLVSYKLPEATEVQKLEKKNLVSFIHIGGRKWQPTPVFLHGESQGRGSLVGCRLWGRTESDTTEVT